MREGGIKIGTGVRFSLPPWGKVSPKVTDEGLSGSISVN